MLTIENLNLCWFVLIRKSKILLFLYTLGSVSYKHTLAEIKVTIRSYINTTVENIFFFKSGLLFATNFFPAKKINSFVASRKILPQIPMKIAICEIIEFTPISLQPIVTWLRDVCDPCIDITEYTPVKK